jgi:hypothetical protein
MATLEWNVIKPIAERLFCVWENGADLDWISQYYYRFNWYYDNDLTLEELKIKVCSIANLYYEFVHEAYYMTYVITDEISEIFE